MRVINDVAGCNGPGVTSIRSRHNYGNIINNRRCMCSLRCPRYTLPIICNRIGLRKLFAHRESDTRRWIFRLWASCTTGAGEIAEPLSSSRPCIFVYIGAFSIDTDIRRKMYLYSARGIGMRSAKIGNGLSVFSADQIFESI